MFIQTEETPNPATLKFLPGCEVAGATTADFPDPATAGRSPLAERLFAIEGLTGVFLGADFVTVTKAENKEWYLLKPAVLGIIMEHFTAGRPVLLDDASAGEEKVSEEDSEVVVQIKELLDTRVRPAVARRLAPSGARSRCALPKKARVSPCRRGPPMPLPPWSTKST